MTYVANIYKYYIAYKLAMEDMAERQKGARGSRETEVASAAAMSDERPPKPLIEHSLRVLSPPERFGEAVFGLIMVLTITGSLSVAEAGQAEIRTMLIGALGCNLAWGIVDAVMYLLGALFERGRARALLNAVRARATTAETARAIVSDALPPVVASVLRTADLDSMRERLARLPEPPRSHRDGRGLARRAGRVPAGLPVDVPGGSALSPGLPRAPWRCASRMSWA